MTVFQRHTVLCMVGVRCIFKWICLLSFVKLGMVPLSQISLKRFYPARNIFSKGMGTQIVGPLFDFGSMMLLSVGYLGFNVHHRAITGSNLD